MCAYDLRSFTDYFQRLTGVEKDLTKLEQSQIKNSSGIKLLCFDLDGTVINSAGIVSDQDLNAIAKAREAGIKVTIASGRPSFTAEHIAKQLGAERACMFFSGSLIIDMLDKSSVAEANLNTEHVLEFVEFGREHGIGTELYTKENYSVDKITPIIDTHRKYINANPEVRDLVEFARNNKLLKIVIGVKENSKDQEVLDDWLSKHNYFHAVSATAADAPDIHYVNFTDHLGSRERAFENLTGYYGVSPQEVMAFGDAKADAMFLKLAGIGIAMSQGAQMAKEAANYIAPEVDKNGVAYTLNKLFGFN